jgi:hypothetical protein
MKDSKVFFFEKKKQKTFICMASASPDRLGSDLQKFFGSFFQKRTASFTEQAASADDRRPEIRAR